MTELIFLCECVIVGHKLLSWYFGLDLLKLAINNCADILLCSCFNWADILNWIWSCLPQVIEIFWCECFHVANFWAELIFWGKSAWPCGLQVIDSGLCVCVGWGVGGGGDLLLLTTHHMMMMAWTYVSARCVNLFILVISQWDDIVESKGSIKPLI